MPVVQNITTTVGGVSLTSATYANPVTVTASGTVTGGITASQGWTVDNEGSIAGQIGINLRVGGTVLNDGSVTVLGTGIYLGGAGAITNASTSALISGATGVDTGTSAAVTVTNFGTIQGTNGIAVNLRSAQDRLVVEAGSRLIGTASGGNGVLAFGSAGGVGTLTALGNGARYGGFASYQVDSGAIWTLAGPSTIASGKSFSDAGFLTVTGSLLNAAAVTVTGSLDNQGSIGGGVVLSGSGQLNNEAGATVAATGTGYAVSATGVANGTVTNAGLVQGFAGILLGSGRLDNSGTVQGTTGLGVELTTAAAGLVNRAGAVISGQFDGVDGLATVDNYGVIESVQGYGVSQGPGGPVTNRASGTIKGLLGGVQTDGSIDNAGTILATGTNSHYQGVYLVATNAGVINRAGGFIEGGYGVKDNGAGTNTVTNYGTIQGTGGIAVQLKTSTDELVIEAGSTLIGSVNGGGGTLVFGAGGGAGSESGVGSGTLSGSAPGIFSGFATYQIQSGADWTFTGANTAGSGTLLADAGTLTVAGSLLANGTFNVSGSLVNGGSIGGGITLSNGAQVTNQSGATLASTGNTVGEAEGSVVSVTNQGLITGGTYGLNLLGTGSVTNAGSGHITAQFGIDIHAGTIDNPPTHHRGGNRRQCHQPGRRADQRADVWH